MIQTCLSSADRNIQQLFVSVSLLNICPATRMSPPACTGGRREAFSLNQGTLTSTSVLCCTQVEVVPSWCERTCRRTWKARCNSDPAAPEKPSPSSVTQNVTAAPASPQWQITPQYCVCLKLSVSRESSLVTHTAHFFPSCVSEFSPSVQAQVIPCIASKSKNGDLPSSEVPISAFNFWCSLQHAYVVHLWQPSDKSYLLFFPLPPFKGTNWGSCS